MPSDPAVLKAIVDHYPPECRGTPFESPADQGFSGAVIARVSAAAGEFCLRGWPVAAPAVERIRGLQRLVSFAHRSGVTQVPVPLAATDGNLLVEAAGRRWQLEPWMPGMADFRDHPGETRLRNIMAVLAAFHRAAAGFEAQPSERPWFACCAAAPSPAVRERREQLDRWQRGRLEQLRGTLALSPDDELRRLAIEVVEHVERVGPSVARQLEAAATLRFALTPCIRDVWHDHVLLSGDEVTGLIDLAACRCENVAADLARLLGSLVGDDLRLWDVALDAYQQHRRLLLDELGLVPVLDRSGVLLSALTWLERRYLRDEAAIDTARVRGRLATIVCRLERMAAS